ncbi:hypothetical protein CA850_31440 [Micromonospora echinospora]|nr:hypothetical protein CA850_31440 [Micromonospora echinospora]
MRPAGVADRGAIEGVIRDRVRWLHRRGLPGSDAVAGALAGQAGTREFPVWVLVDGAEVVGCTSLYDESPAWLWTEEERARPGLFVASTWIHPRYAGQGVGCQLAWWALDHAARAGRVCVRRATVEPALVAYYRDVQGWRIVREVRRRDRAVTALTRRAQAMPGLLIPPYAA